MDSEDKNAEIVPGACRTDVGKDTGHQPLTQPEAGNACVKSAKEIRDIFKNFFNSPAGAVSWQNEYVNK